MDAWQSRQSAVMLLRISSRQFRPPSERLAGNHANAQKPRIDSKAPHHSRHCLEMRGRLSGEAVSVDGQIAERLNRRSLTETTTGESLSAAFAPDVPQK